VVFFFFGIYFLVGFGVVFGVVCFTRRPTHATYSFYPSPPTSIFFFPSPLPSAVVAENPPFNDFFFRYHPFGSLIRTHVRASHPPLAFTSFPIWSYLLFLYGREVFPSFTRTFPPPSGISLDENACSNLFLLTVQLGVWPLGTFPCRVRRLLPSFQILGFRGGGFGRFL